MLTLESAKSTFAVYPRNQHIPKVSIGLPVYNGEEFIAEAIRSVLDQSYVDFELIISDNNSTDKTIEICNYYAKLDKRIKLYKHDENIGMVENFNFLIENSWGEYVCWLSHDDYWSPKYLEILLYEFNNNQELTTVISPCRLVLPDKKPFKPSLIINDFSGAHSGAQLSKYWNISGAGEGLNDWASRDIIIYGLHKNEIIKDKFRFRRWRFINKEYNTNLAHNLAIHLLAVGKIKCTSDYEAVLYKRVRYSCKTKLGFWGKLLVKIRETDRKLQLIVRALLTYISEEKVKPYFFSVATKTLSFYFKTQYELYFKRSRD